MCSHKMDAQLYGKLKDLTEAHVKRNVDTFTGGSMDKLVNTNSNIHYIQKTDVKM